MIIKTPLDINTLLTNRFANKYQGDARTLRIGNIISYIGPVDTVIDEKVQKSDESINFVLEIPELSNYAGVCFQRLFITNVANILANTYFKEQIEIINNDMIIKKEHTNSGIHQLDGIISISTIKNINGAILIYLGLYNIAGENSQPRAFSISFDEPTCHKFMDDVNGSFYHLANTIFLRTAKM